MTSHLNKKKRAPPLALINTGASLLERSFLWTHRKLISTMSSVLPLAQIRAGIAVMNPISRPLVPARTPRCHSGSKPGT